MQDNIVWHPEALPRDAHKTLATLGTQSAVNAFYLAGGTALALQWGYRKSADLASRGAKRDFVDLYVLSKKYGLKELMSLFHQKFAKATFSNIHLLKSLTYFADAEKEPMPDMLQSVTWKEVKHFFIAEVRRLRS